MKRGWFPMGALFGAAGALFLALTVGAPFGRRVEDLALRQRGIDQDPAPFVVIALDDATVEEWPRSLASWGPEYAAVIRKAFAGGAKGVVMDVVLLAESNPTDTALADCVAEFGERLVICFRFDRNGVGRGPEGVLGTVVADRGMGNGTGVANIPSDPDGMPRRGFRQVGGFSSISSAAARLAGGAASERSEPAEFRADLLRFEIRFASALNLRRSDVEGRVALLGFTDALSVDFKPYPSGGERSGVEVQTRHAASLWAGTDLVEPASAILGLGLAGLTAVVAVLARYHHGYGLVAASLAAAAAVLSWRWGVALPILAISAVGMGAWSGELAARALVALRTRQRIAAAFATQLSAEIVDDLIVTGGTGRELTGTIMFVDVRGSSSLARTAGPKGTIAALNELFGRLLPIVRSHGGIVHGFMGDGFFATFGALAPLENDARSGVAAAREMLEVYRDEGPRYGIGLHRGSFVLGNIGNEERAQYTCIGDAVNVAARVEGATKDRASMLATEQVADLVPELVWIALDAVPLAGMESRKLLKIAPFPEISGN